MVLISFMMLCFVTLQMRIRKNAYDPHGLVALMVDCQATFIIVVCVVNAVYMAIHVAEIIRQILRDLLWTTSPYLQMIAERIF